MNSQQEFTKLGETYLINTVLTKAD